MDAIASSPFLLSCSQSGLQGQLIAPPPGMPTLINETTPVRYIWRRIAQPGKWTNQTLGFTLNLSEAKLDDISKNINGMIQAGIAIPLVCDHTQAAASTLGYLKAAKIDGPWLMGLCQVTGESELGVFNKNYISGGFAPDYTDSTGKQWGDTLVHVGFTPRPVIGTEKLLAASQSATGSRAIVLSMAEGQDFMNGMLPCSDSQLQTLHKKVPGLADQPDEGKIPHLINYLNDCSTSDMNDVGPGVATMSMVDISSAAKANRAKWKADSERLAAMSAADKAKEIPSHVVELVRSTVTDILSEGLANGKLTDDQHKDAVAMLVGPVGSPATLNMSAAADGKIPAVAMARLLCSLSPVAVGGVTRTRTVPTGGPGVTPPVIEKKMPFESAQGRIPKLVAPTF